MACIRNGSFNPKPGTLLQTSKGPRIAGVPAGHLPAEIQSVATSVVRGASATESKPVNRVAPNGEDSGQFFTMKYSLFSQRFRIIEPCPGTFIAQWRIWWLPFWCNFEHGDGSAKSFESLERAREFIREEQAPAFKPIIHKP